MVVQPSRLCANTDGWTESFAKSELDSQGTTVPHSPKYRRIGIGAAIGLLEGVDGGERDVEEIGLDNDRYDEYDDDRVLADP